MLDPRSPVLVFDTSAAHCAAALICADARHTRYEAMTKGQAERLIPLLEELLAEAGLGFGDLGGLAVGVGPGNFTGVRIAVSAARGLALALGVPVFGISSFEMMRDTSDLGAPPAELVSLAAPRDQAYVQAFRFGRPIAKPVLIDPAQTPAELALPGLLQVTGHRAAEIGASFAARIHPGATLDAPEALPSRMAEVALWKMAQPDLDLRRRPAPLYVRPADAAPPSEAPPVILDL